ncbi:MAG: nitronate monooxygenase, partial [Parvularculaceae bacterium]
MDFDRLNFVLSPARSRTVDIAIAASRAGWIGVFNAEVDRDPDECSALLARLVRFGGERIGLKLPALDDAWLALLRRAERPIDFVIVNGDDADVEGVAALRALSGKVVVETSAWSDRVADFATVADAFWLKGHEAGGFVGEQTSFMLLRDAARRTQAPLCVRGGINTDSAAAAIVGGAAGVVLDDQLLLLDESPLKADWAGRLKRFSGVETIFCDGGAGARHLRFWSPPGRTDARALAAEIARNGAIEPQHAARPVS